MPLLFGFYRPPKNCYKHSINLQIIQASQPGAQRIADFEQMMEIST